MKEVSLEEYIDAKKLSFSRESLNGISRASYARKLSINFDPDDSNFEFGPRFEDIFNVNQLDFDSKNLFFGGLLIQLL